MRPHSRYIADPTFPRAKGKCDRCQKIYQHHTLTWQFQWVGAKLQNLRLLVCESCYDTPQPGLRAIILPADPIPIMNPRPELYTVDNNPVSTLGTNIGSLTQGAGLVAAFSFGANKPLTMSATTYTSIAGYENWVGKNWGDGETVLVSRFIVQAPNDAGFIAGGAYKFQGSTTGVVWIDISAGTAIGTIAEIIDVSLSTGVEYQYHRIVFDGDGISAIGVAQFAIYSANQSNEGDS